MEFCARISTLRETAAIQGSCIFVNISKRNFFKYPSLAPSVGQFVDQNYYNHTRHRRTPAARGRQRSSRDQGSCQSCRAAARSRWGADCNRCYSPNSQDRHLKMYLLYNKTIYYAPRGLYGYLWSRGVRGRNHPHF